MDITELVGDYQLNQNKNMFTKHNLAMLGGLAVIFITAVYPFFHGGMTPAEIFTAIVTGLVAVEHARAGNNGATS